REPTDLPGRGDLREAARIPVADAGGATGVRRPLPADLSELAGLTGREDQVSHRASGRAFNTRCPSCVIWIICSRMTPPTPVTPTPGSMHRHIPGRRTT